MPNESLTEQQRNWIAKVKASLETSTGKTLDDWVAVARTNPETRPRARVQWMKAHHGLGQNYAMHVLHALAEADGAPLRDREDARAALWKDPTARAVLEAVEAVVRGFPGLVEGQRKGFSAFSHHYQFAAIRPARGAVRLGLALPVDADPRLEPAAREGWSDRCTATLVLKTAAEVDEAAAALLKSAYERS